MSNKLKEFDPVYRDTSIKIDKVTISYEKSGAAKVRFTINRKVFSHGVGRLDNTLYTDRIINICQGIAVDLRLGRFNPDNWKEHYFGAKPKISNTVSSDTEKASNDTTTTSDNKSLNRLSTVWANYLEFKGDSLSHNTVSNDIRSVVSALKLMAETDNNLDDLKNIENFVRWLSTKYSDNTQIKILTYLNSAFTIAIKQGKIAGNPIFLYLENVRKKVQNKPVSAYSLEDAETIVKCFYDNRYPLISSLSTTRRGEVKEHFTSDSKKWAKHYAPLIRLRFLTGMRPSEAHALTWSDIVIKDEKPQIRINKRLSIDGKKVEEGTKNKAWCRHFPINDDLQQLLDSIPKIENRHNLIFPSYSDRDYIKARDVESPSRIFSQICDGLFNDGLISENLPYYACRHTFITHVMRTKEIDISTLARLVGNSPDVLLKRYFASEKDVTIPKLF